jgi:hypothetical protein
VALFRRGQRVPDEEPARSDDDFVEYDDGYGEYDDADGPDEATDLDDEVFGPFDEAEAPDDDFARLDLGSVLLPLPPQSQIQVEVDPQGPVRAVHVITPNGQYTIQAYAAPRSGDLWPDISRELAEQLHGDGARVRRENGEWGTELVAFVNDALLRFVGVDGPRWMLRAVAASSKESSAAAAEELRDIVRGSVVVRGDQPMPVRTPLPIELPDEIAQHIEQAKTEGGWPSG